ncbi:MAG: alpha-amylase family protein [Paludibacteraceae bacterium]|nr:alpha-amylase family protein [Paludibacteraceae bacterium]
MIIYQILPRLFGNANENRIPNGSRKQNGCGTMADITPRALRAIAELGATHVWYTGIIRHATGERNNPAITKGKAGSPYAITDYYDVHPDIAADEKNRMAEFEALVRRTHRAGLKVIMDFVPNHVARQYKSKAKPKGVRDLGQDDNPNWAFSPLNNFYYLPGMPFSMDRDLQGYEEMPAKVTGNDCFTCQPSEGDWYETVKLNYGVFYQGGGEKQFSPIPNTWEKMRDILLFWAGKGIDGLRVDMAEMVPVEFFEWVIPQIKARHKKLIFIGECYDPNRYWAYIHAGFDYLYDKVGMYDYLRGVVSRGWSAEGISGRWLERGEQLKHMLYFLENHDEQRLASGFFCGNGANAEPAMVVAAALTPNPLLIYMGQELGEKGMDFEGFSGIDGRTSIFDFWSLRSLQAWSNHGQYDGGGLDDEQRSLRAFYQRLLCLKRDNRALSEGKMYDLQYAQGEGFNRARQFVFLRYVKGDLLLVVVNFDDRRVDLRINIPTDAFVYLGLEACTHARMTDLLNGGESFTQPFTDEQPVCLSLDAWKGAIIKIERP